MNIAEMFKDLLAQLKAEIVEDKSAWPQVAKLTPEDCLKRRNYERDTNKLMRKMNVLKKQADVIQSQNEAMGAEWWAHLHDAYQLPETGNYHITDDNRVLRKPDEEKKKGVYDA